ncbi:hypothetical protein C8R44DRAFT_855319 [Mycena epipterygia]|nr:hypothetical protein C8R44DRAFT_855319 [Mycena epipterygia]
MAHTTMQRKSFVFIFVGTFLLFLAPTVLESYPQTAALASALTWVGNKVSQGVTTFIFLIAVCMLSSLVGDFRAWLTSTAAPITPTPAELEDGTATPPSELPVPDAAAAAAAAAAATPTEPAANAKPSTLRAILTLICSGVYFAFDFFQRDIVSLDKPLLENVGAALLFLLRGFEIIFVMFLVLVVGARLAMGSRSARRAAVAEAAAAAAPPTVLFDEGEVAEVPAAKGEKEALEVELA